MGWICVLVKREFTKKSQFQMKQVKLKYQIDRILHFNIKEGFRPLTPKINVEKQN